MLLSKKLDVKKTYVDTMIKLARKDNRIVVVEADAAKCSGSVKFSQEFPERFFQVGIAEQNLVGVCAGLSSMGLIPFCSAFACFISQRSCDQALNSVAYNNFNVKLIGTYAGITTERNGGTHMSVEDIAIYRSMPNMIVLEPGDCLEFEQMIETIAKYEGAVYLRVSRGPLPTVMPEDYKFVLGKSVLMREGKDVTLISAGYMTIESIKACDILNSCGISVRHIHMPTIKPIDEEAVLKAARETGAIVTVENHSILGGLGSAVTETVCSSCPVIVKRLGMDDMFGDTASIDWLMEKYKMSAKHIVDAVKLAQSHKR